MAIRRGILLLLLLLLGGLTGVGGPALAAEKPGPDASSLRESIVVRLDVVNLTDDGATRMGDSGRLPGPVLAQLSEKGHARVIQSVEMIVLSDSDASLLVGRKNPIIYYDLKATQFQVQFVDTGIRLSVRAKTTGGEHLRIETAVEVSPTETMRAYTDPVGTSAYPQTSIQTTRTILPRVRYGDSVVVSHSTGTSVTRFLKLLDAPALGDHLVLVLTPTRP